MTRLGIDIGGTFTDLTGIDPASGELFHLKTLTTPEEPARGVIDALDTAGLQLDTISFLVHGTTVGLNSFLERKGARVLLVMTSGISDTYTVARGDRKELYNVQYKKPQQLVPRKDVMEVRERMQWDGKIIEEINKDDLIKVIKKINSENIDAIAICFLHSYVNPKHEQLAKEFIKKEVDSKFKGMIKALSYGAPPHGGMAPGIDRIVMLLAGKQNIREITLFPMNQNAEDLLMEAPSEASQTQLKELNIKVLEKKK